MRSRVNPGADGQRAGAPARPGRPTAGVGVCVCVSADEGSELRASHCRYRRATRQVSPGRGWSARLSPETRDRTAIHEWNGHRRLRDGRDPREETTGEGGHGHGGDGATDESHKTLQTSRNGLAEVIWRGTFGTRRLVFLTAALGSWEGDKPSLKPFRNMRMKSLAVPDTAQIQPSAPQDFRRASGYFGRIHVAAIDSTQAKCRAHVHVTAKIAERYLPGFSYI